MFARITTFTGDARRFDEAIAFVRDRVQPIVDALDGCLGMSVLTSTEAGRLTAVSAWTSTAARAAGATALAPLRDEAAAILGGTYTTEELELAAVERLRPAQDGYCARAVRVRVDPARVDDLVEGFRREAVPYLRTLPGLCSAVMLVDRAAGTALVTSTYVNRTALDASREPVRRLRERVTAASGATVLEIVEGDVAIAGIRAPNEYEATVSRLYAALSAGGNLDDLDALVAEDAVDHAPVPAGTPPGRAGLKAIMSSYREAFPDLRFRVERYLEQGDTACAVIRVSGTNTGPFLGAPPTGRAIDILAVDVIRHENGLCVEHWGASDDLGLLGQLGRLSIPQQGATTEAPSAANV